MNDAREIIAMHLCAMAAQEWSGISELDRAAYRTTASGMVEAITSAGYRVLGPGELDPETVEKCAEVVRKLPDRRYADNVGYVTVPPNREDFATAIEATAIRALAKEKQG